MGEPYDLETGPDETQNRGDDPGYASVELNCFDTRADRMAATVDSLPEQQAAR